MIRTLTTRRKLLRLITSIAALLLVSGIATAQRQERVVSSWKPVHYDVSISFNDQLTEISAARTEITLKVLAADLAKIDLDFGELPVDSVSISGQPAKYERTPDLLNVILPRPSRQGAELTITVNYHGRPKDGLILAKDPDGKPAATGDNWPNRVHQWIPCLDHPSAKATVSFTVFAAAREGVVANGRLVSQLGDLPLRSVWKFEETKPIPAYCMVIAASEGAKLDAIEPTITPLSYYVPQRDRAYAPKGFAPGAPALAFFTATVGPYPYEKLALIIGSTRFGGMENSSAIVFPSTLFAPRANDRMSARFGIPARIESVVAHEIAHQWFGDSVIESTWADLWLSEGFATYFAGLFIEKYEGEQAFRDYMQDAANRYFAYEKQRAAPIHDTATLDLMKLLNANNYEKGAWVLHMLRRSLGDEAFFRALRAYYNAHRDGNATTEDLRMALEKESKVSLKDFFSRWIYGAGHPQYKATWNWSGRRSRGGALTVTLEQTQSGASFLMPVPIEIVNPNGITRQTIKPSGKLTITRFPLNSPPTELRVDPGETILKEVIVQALQ